MTLLLELAVITSENLRLGSSIQFPRLTVWKSPSIACKDYRKWRPTGWLVNVAHRKGDGD